MFLIRDFDEARHLTGVRACLIELQDFERSLDPRMPSGAEVVDDYIPKMLKRCVECNGIVLVAESNEKVAGFATTLIKSEVKNLEDANIEYGLISDLIVSSQFRKRGLGKVLLQAAESYAECNGVRWLRVSVLAENHVADNLYDSMGSKSCSLSARKNLLGHDERLSPFLQCRLAGVSFLIRI